VLRARAAQAIVSESKNLTRRNAHQERPDASDKRPLRDDAPVSARQFVLVEHQPRRRNRFACGFLRKEPLC
jgi:hypothetical protein